MRKGLVLSYFIYIIFLSMSYGQKAQQVTIEGYSEPVPSSVPAAMRNSQRSMPLIPNQNNAPVSNSLNPLSSSNPPSSPKSMLPPVALPQGTGAANLPQPLAQPSGPTSTIQPNLPATQPLPPSVPAPEQPNNSSIGIIQKSGTTSNATHVSSPAQLMVIKNHSENISSSSNQSQIGRTSSMMTAPMGNQLDSSESMITAPTTSNNSMSDQMLPSTNRSEIENTNPMMNAQSWNLNAPRNSVAK